MKNFTTPGMEFFLISFMIPFVLISGMLPKHTNDIVLVSAFATAGFATRYRLVRKSWTWKELGFRTDNITPTSILICLCITMILCVGFVALYDNGTRNALGVSDIVKSFFYSFLQVVLYQGYLMKIGKEIFKNDFVNITLNVALYTYMHLFYDLSRYEYLLLAIAGLVFALSYRFFKNTYLVAIIHFATNLLALRMGMFHPG